MDGPDDGRTPASWRSTALAIVACTAFLASFTIVGADCYWLVALGDAIREQGGVPEGLPFAAAPTDDWPNVLVLAELVMSLVHGLGSWALPTLQVLAVAAAATLLASQARRAGAGDLATAAVLVVAVLGSLPSLVVVRLQLFSFVPFALLLVLLRAEHARPSRRVWWLVGLVALWGNLHGAVLLGVCVAGCYLLFSRLRLRPAETVAVGTATLLALLATPAGVRTVPYYLGVMQNEAAKRGDGLWARPTPDNPFDVLMVLAAVALLGIALRKRLPLWEYAVLVGLAVGTLSASRHGVWLLLVLLLPAAVSATRGDGRSVTPSPRAPLVCWLAAAVLAPALVVARGEAVLPDGHDVADEVAAVAAGQVVLAPEPLAESLAVAGVTLWAADPIDAFAAEDQAAFLDFLDGTPGGLRAVKESDLVVVGEDTEPADLMSGQQGWEAEELAEGWLIYRRAR